MIKWRLGEDLRVSAGVDPTSLYRVALDQAKWCDEHGLTEMWTSEHHGHDEVASPLAFCAAVGAVTKRARLAVGCVLLPLHDPVRLAEDIILADLVSQGRMEAVLGLGYVQQEYTMFGTSASGRRAAADERLPVLLDCLAGEEFEYGGRRGRVRPGPYQRPRPPILIGGGVAASARRAARFGDGFAPTVMDEALHQQYRDECQRLGRPVGPVLLPNLPFFVHVSEDPERAWAKIGPHLLDEVNLYGRRASEAGSPQIGYSPTVETINDVAVVRDMPMFAVLTPEQTVKMAKALPDGSALWSKPLRVAPDLELGWESLELLVNRVLPELDIAPPTPSAIPLTSASR